METEVLVLENRPGSAGPPVGPVWWWFRRWRVVQVQRRESSLLGEAEAVKGPRAETDRFWYQPIQRRRVSAENQRTCCHRIRIQELGGGQRLRFRGFTKFTGAVWSDWSEPVIREQNPSSSDQSWFYDVYIQVFWLLLVRFKVFRVFPLNCLVEVSWSPSSLWEKIYRDMVLIMSKDPQNQTEHVLVLGVPGGNPDQDA